MLDFGISNTATMKALTKKLKMLNIHVIELTYVSLSSINSRDIRITIVILFLLQTSISLILKM